MWDVRFSRVKVESFGSSSAVWIWSCNYPTFWSCLKDGDGRIICREDESWFDNFCVSLKYSILYFLSFKIWFHIRFVSFNFKYLILDLRFNEFQWQINIRQMIRIAFLVIYDFIKDSISCKWVSRFGLNLVEFQK